MALTEKQRAFAANLAAGLPQGEAYRLAYQPSNPNESTIRAAASNEAKKPAIQQYVNELRDKQQKTEALTNSAQTEWIKNLILERIEICRKNDNETAIARYCDILNKMLGNYTSADVDKTENNLRDMSTDELKALLQAPQSA